MGDAAAIRRLGEAVASRLPRLPLVVVSAVSGITDSLILLARAAAGGEQQTVKDQISKIRNRHQEFAAELSLPQPSSFLNVLHAAEGEIRHICKELSSDTHRRKALSDHLLSYGEFLSSHLVSCYLNSIGIPAQMFDVRNVLLTDSDFGKARPDFYASREKARSLLAPLLQENRVPIVQGFVGRDSNGNTTTLGRGGSDYSATLLGSMLDAQCVEIWTDVSGIMTADPNLVPEAKRIRSMTFQEAAELAYFGARVLHPATIYPAVSQGIPVFVLNSRNPAQSGTEIRASRGETRRNGALVKSIAYKKSLTVITVNSSRMLMAYGFMARIFQVFEAFKTSVDLITTSEVSVSMSIDDTQHLEAITRELKEFADVEVQHNKAIVCVVGENIRQSVGIPAKIFSQLEDIPIHLISQGASEINISFVIDEPQVPEVVRRLHRHLFRQPLDQDVFVA